MNLNDIIASPDWQTEALRGTKYDENRMTESGRHGDVLIVEDMVTNAAKVQVYAALVEVLVGALGNTRSYMIPGMNWTDQIGEQLKCDANRALDIARAVIEKVVG